MSDVLTRLDNLKNLSETMLALREGRFSADEVTRMLGTPPSGSSAGPTTPQTASTSKRISTRVSQASVSSDEPHQPVKACEAELMSLFPINVYTKAMHWLLSRRVVRRFLYYETLKQVYTGFTTTKPDMENCVGAYLEYTLSTRLQAHLGKALTKGATSSSLFHFGRFPLPEPILSIATEEIMKMAKKRAEGSKDEADFMKERCTTIKRTFINNGEWPTKAPSQEVMALRLFWERMSFFQKHKVTRFAFVP